ncbi:MAG TPA: glucose-6-phosphate isomerase [Burkholderiaceae bacterium]|jgi:glucose-6-phosphate isomerase|nr:glucose-6-phosphate isomerase [Burkholderiaceae bacterium]
MLQDDLPATPAFQALQAHRAEVESLHLLNLFAREPERFEKFSVEAASLFLDYSKNHLTRTTLQLLLALARERGVESQRDAMFAGQKVNTTEQRAALHTALRAPRGSAIWLDGRNIVDDVHAVLDRIKTFTEQVRSGAWLGYTGQPITDIVHIGIGGSYLGPAMACRALRPLVHPRLSLHFIANVDGHDLDATLCAVDPATTLFIVASKTFTTMETMMNARSARKWFLSHAGEADLPKHFVAVSTNLDAVKAFGIDPANMFQFWDWVGGRYSIWSAIGLPLALAVGFERFAEFLGGAHAMDRHFRTAPLERNMPVLLALIGFWYRDFFDAASVSIAPYHQDLQRFPAYLQQLEMESNGKGVTRDGAPVGVPTCPVIWGDVGTNGQHAYFQLLHQGTDLIPVDFIAVLRPAHGLQGHHSALLANCFAQSEALMRGKTEDEARAELQIQGMDKERIDVLAPHKVFPGNHPSNTILMDALTPASLGSLIALYEHKVFVQGILWGVNSFDQWGVELGKTLANHIREELTGEANPPAHDCSTNGLVARARIAMR